MSEQVFRDFQSSSLTSFFHNFWKVWNRTNSEFSVNSECSETPVSELFPNFSQLFANFLTKNRLFLTLKQEIISEFFSQNFREFEKNGYLRKISEIRKTNFSETCENKKFRNFHLTQGLNLKFILINFKWHLT